MRDLGEIHHLKHDPRCPLCGTVLSGACGFDTDVRPKPEDASICTTCYSFLLYTEDLQLRAMSPAEFEALESEERFQLLQALQVCRMANATLGRDIKPSSPAQ